MKVRTRIVSLALAAGVAGASWLVTAPPASGQVVANNLVGLNISGNQVVVSDVADVGAMKDKNARSVTASIMGVEAQHSAILRAVKALLAANAANLIALPPDAAALPGAAGSLGFPDGFFPTSSARPAKEGAVR